MASPARILLAMTYFWGVGIQVMDLDYASSIMGNYFNRDLDNPVSNIVT